MQSKKTEQQIQNDETAAKKGLTADEAKVIRQPVTRSRTYVAPTPERSRKDRLF